MNTRLPDYEAVHHSEIFGSVPKSLRDDLQYMLTRRSSLWWGATIADGDAVKDFDPDSHSVRVEIVRRGGGISAGKVSVITEGLSIVGHGRAVERIFDDAIEALDYMATEIIRYA